MMADANRAMAATYQPLAGIPMTVRIIMRDDLAREQYGFDTALPMGRRYVQVLRSAIAAPARDDTLAAGGITYSVDGPDLGRSNEYFWILVLTR